MAALAQDAMLGERYRVISRIAIGGMGEVWRAEDTLLHRPVAVKVLKTELSVDPTFLERFRNEARSAAAFSHSGIAGVFDYGETEPRDAPTAYLVMELVEGEPLSAILAREGRLSVPRTLDYVGKAAIALQVAHQTGMVHRDIKPGNLLITGDGQVKITDFGIARAASTIRHTQAGMVVGTAQYFSPEQAEGRTVGPASDVYSLGVVAYECLSGQPPFTADSPVTVAVMQIRNVPPPLPPDVPPPVRAVVERAMAKDPRWRYVNGGELANAVIAAKAGRFEQSPPRPVGPVSRGVPPPLGPALTARPPAPRPPNVPQRDPQRRVGRRLVWVAGLLATVILAAVVVWLVTHRDSYRDTGSDMVRGTAADSPRSTPLAGTATPSTTSQAGGQADIDPESYVGRSLSTTLRQLRRAGMQPILSDTGEEPAGREHAKGTVKALMAPPGQRIEPLPEQPSHEQRANR